MIGFSTTHGVALADNMLRIKKKNDTTNNRCNRAMKIQYKYPSDSKCHYEVHSRGQNSTNQITPSRTCRIELRGVNWEMFS